MTSPLMIAGDLERGAAGSLVGAGVGNGRRDDDGGARTSAVTVSDLTGGHDPIYIYTSKYR